ncbi:MAG: glycosyltransferase family 2 protein [Acidiferrobacteraceae bacterium]
MVHKPAALVGRGFGRTPTEVQMFMPAGDDADSVPEVSIVVPALNEEITIGEFVEWCKEGLARAGTSGEVLIVDSSADMTPMIALEHGARVLRTPRRGLGRAYIDAIPYIRGKFVIMGDCDLTYDFRELRPFTERYRDGYEFVMGSRFRGSIQHGAMPALHRYFGTPVTTWIMNFIYRSRFSDIHCGMRGFTKIALEKLALQSQSWEYASEMVLKASRLGLRTAEVPVHFYKDRDGRLSHHRRAGFWSPWTAGWSNLRVMLIYTPDSFLLRPGVLLLLLGSLMTVSLSRGGYNIGRFGFDLHWMLLSLTTSVLGYGCVQIGILASVYHGLRPSRERWFYKLFTYDRGMVVAAALTVSGVFLNAQLLWRYIEGGLRLSQVSYAAVFGLFLVIMGFQTFALTLLAEMMRAGRVPR